MIYAHRNQIPWSKTGALLAVVFFFGLTLASSSDSRGGQGAPQTKRSQDVYDTAIPARAAQVVRLIESLGFRAETWGPPFTWEWRPVPSKPGTYAFAGGHFKATPLAPQPGKVASLDVFINEAIEHPETESDEYDYSGIYGGLAMGFGSDIFEDEFKKFIPVPGCKNGIWVGTRNRGKVGAIKCLSVSIQAFGPRELIFYRRSEQSPRNDELRRQIVEYLDFVPGYLLGIQAKLREAGLCRCAPPPPPAPPPAGADAYATIIAMDGDVSYKEGLGGGWPECRVGQRVGSNVELHTGPESSVTLQYLDGSTLVVKELTQLMIGILLVRADRYKMELLLKLGEIKASVPHRETVRSDFHCGTPAAVSSVRGTVFIVRHDATTESTTVSVEEGEVLVTPTNTTLSPVTLSAGQRMRVTLNGVEKLTPPETGKVDVAPRGDQPLRAAQPPAPAGAKIVLPYDSAEIGMRNGQIVAIVVQNASYYEQQGLVVGSRLISIDMVPLSVRSLEEVKRLLNPTDSDMVVLEFVRPDGQSIHIPIPVRKQA